mmetsp:Transcript_58946/g.156927  ORF Transcript_58946/g.156927 Transcript_58946/m.156927 type:complete len:244 (+) Transcript_58946:1185-1916(+)
MYSPSSLFKILKISSVMRGMRPRMSPVSAPKMVWLFPLPDCPYAKRQPLYPAATPCAMRAPMRLWTSSCVACCCRTQSKGCSDGLLSIIFGGMSLTIGIPLSSRVTHSPMPLSISSWFIGRTRKHALMTASPLKSKVFLVLGEVNLLSRGLDAPCASDFSRNGEVDPASGDLVRPLSGELASSSPFSERLLRLASDSVRFLVEFNERLLLFGVSHLGLDEDETPRTGILAEGRPAAVFLRPQE